MDDYIELYLDERWRNGDLADSSLPVIRSALVRFARHVNHSLIGVDERDVHTWLAGPYTEQTRKSMITKLRPFVQWLARRGVIQRDFTAGITIRIYEERTPRDMPQDAVARLLEVCPDFRARLIVLLMVQCGLRAGEVARIRVEDIDQRRRILHVRGKGGRGQVNGSVPIPDEAWAYVREGLRARAVLAGVFITGYNRPIGGLTPHTVSKYVASWMRAAGLKAFPHDGVSAHALRHTMAQDLLDRGADPRTVQYGLRHRSLRTTELYLRREPPGLRDAMEGRRYIDGGQGRWADTA